jgi:pheromone shutdown protein TraB
MIETRDGITLVGTAHILKSSVVEVEEAIRRIRPAKVLVELDAGRLKALQDPEAWQNTDIFRVLRERKQHLFLLQLYLAAMQAQMGRETGVSPGADMLRGVQVAEEVGAEVVLIDRDVAITLRRGFGAMGLWSRLRLFWKVWMELLTPADPNAPPPDLETVMKSDAITEMTEQFAKFAPEIKTALIDERDEFMASHIREQARLVAMGAPRTQEPAPAAGPDAGAQSLPPPGTPAQALPIPQVVPPGAAPQPVTQRGGIVAVVGAGHLKGIQRWLDHPAEILPRDRLMERPPRKFPWGTTISIAISLAIFGLIAWRLPEGGTEYLFRVTWWWIGLHGGLAALGAILALGHPLAVLAGGASAPVTSLIPIVKSGYLAGLVQASLRRPKVKDFQAIKHVDTFGQFWRNGIVRILMVMSLTILGSIAGKTIFFAMLAQGWI